MTDVHSHFQRMAFAVFIAFRALKTGETPVACVFVHDKSQKILSYGCNDTNRSLNGTRHAEFVGIDKILKIHNLIGASSEDVRAFFSEVILYVTIEPCVMCASALRQVGIKKVYFGAANDRFGGNGTVIKAQGSYYQSVGGLMRVEAVHLLREFYIQENGSAPVPKIKKIKDINGKDFPDNLSFDLYMTREDFVREFGEQRAAIFYDKRAEQLEITPIEGYTISDLLTREKLEIIPEVHNLYPAGSPHFEKDIECLQYMLPKVLPNGMVQFSNKNETKKRKLEQ